MARKAELFKEEVSIKLPKTGIQLKGILSIPQGAQSLVIFAHGSGSSRHSPRNQFVAEMLQEKQLATLLMDLLTPEEEAIDQETAALRFDIPLLAERLLGATEWVKTFPQTRSLQIGFFGSSTGSAAALIAAASAGSKVKAVVSRGGRPDLAMNFLPQVTAPTLLIVGGDDYGVIELNQEARALIKGESELTIVPGATHLFEEPGKLQEVAKLAGGWFKKHLAI